MSPSNSAQQNNTVIAPPPIPGVTPLPAPGTAPAAPPHTPVGPGQVIIGSVSTTRVVTPNSASSSQPTPQPSAPPVAPRAQDCLNCPSFIGASEEYRQIETFGKATGIDMCGRKSIPLSSLHNDTNANAALRTRMAGVCSEYGNTGTEDRERATGHSRCRIAITSAELVAKSEQMMKEPDFKKPSACSGCAFFRPSGDVFGEFGFPLDLCTLHGRLILPGKGTELASKCQNGVQGFDHAEAKMPTKEILLTPYGDSLTFMDNYLTADATDGLVEGLHPDPTTYKTDKPLTVEDQAYGIRAWRKLRDPDGGKRFVYMPIFDPNTFTPAQRDKIPVAGGDAGDEHPELYQDHHGLLYMAVVLWTQLNETPALNGVAGVGKTEFFRYAAWSMQLPFTRISITNSTELDDLQGKRTLVAGENGSETPFVYGRVSQAWTERGVMCIDEPNTGTPDVWQFFRPLTDNSKQLVLDVNEGERLTRNKHCYMGMAFNPAWDMRNVGTHEIGDADGSRLMHIEVPMPSEEQERDILRRRCLLDGYQVPEKTLDILMNVADELRRLAADDAFPVHWGVRNQIKVARASAWVDLPRAYRLAAGDFLEPQYREQLLMIVKSHGGRARPKRGGTPNGGVRGPRTRQPQI